MEARIICVEVNGDTPDLRKALADVLAALDASPPSAANVSRETAIDTAPAEPQKKNAPASESSTVSEPTAVASSSPVANSSRVPWGQGPRLVLECLLQADRPLRPRDIAAATGFRERSIGALLTRLCKAKKIERHPHGGYRPTSSDDETNSSSGTGVTSCA